MLFWICANLSAAICGIFGRWQVIGRENVPKKGGALLCANHVSYIDPPALGARATRQVHFMAKSELFEIPVIGLIIKGLGAFPVKRGTPDRGALKKAIELLQGGEVVGMFPEGTRNQSPAELQAPEAGVGMIALRAGVPVIPVALVNTERMLPPHSMLLKFTRIKVIYGKPVPLDDILGQGGREAVEEAGRRIMAAIGELLEQHRR